MTPRPTLGLNLPYVEGSMDGATPRWSDLVAMARTAEDVGFDALWVSDHVGFGEPTGEWNGGWEAWTLLSALAAATHRVQLGTYVLAMPFRSPALLAKMAETLDEISGGRVILGVGAGWNEIEFSSYGLPFDDRFDRFEDGLRIITAMLRDGVATHAGSTVHTDHARIAPRGPRPEGLPVMVGAGGPRMLRLTAELADHWNGGLRSVEEVPALLEGLDHACAAVGRGSGTLTRSVEVLVRSLPSSDETLPPEPRELRGDPATLAEALRQYADLGIDHLQVQLRPNRVEAVAAFEPVIAALRT